ncbi:PAAR domain-containing protein [Duganella sp. BJB488]|uniref:PAAR domain-containing protein n=1 Tax=unclassified Duganella TaxID=2636909 RepID=UPI000E341F87|nr:MULTISPECIES: PAAR domain-containing protein [unclassified Duganella]RFP09096.1 PAAR domain-containing protein [Duganella sp. BJB489]RFP12526.1 PAAR domain-containing protein [Duganella sp. BJB488]RFP29095.1 PAAR domain-containing protein [Duganella sp. BJB480]
MKNSKGKGVIRLGDMTSHGGKVISGASDFKALGKAIVVDGDMTSCPQCKGNFPVQVSASERQHHGKAVAYDGDKAACGATLISSI